VAPGRREAGADQGGVGRSVRPVMWRPPRAHIDPGQSSCTG
jgi:hypothetical protein